MTLHEKKRIQKSLWLRFKSKTPLFFKRLGLISVAAGTSLFSFSGYIADQFPQYITLEARLETIGGVLTVFVPIVCKLAVDFDSAIKTK